MNKERELLKQAEELIHTISMMASADGVRIPNNMGIALRLEIQELLAQPEQEPLLIETKIEWYGKGFRQGVNEFAPPKPLTEDVIYALDDEGIVENMSVHQVRYVLRWIRRVEKAHGIGGK